LVSAPTKLRQMFYTQIERRTFHKKPDSDARSGSGAKRTFGKWVMSAKCQHRKSYLLENRVGVAKSLCCATYLERLC